MVMNVVPIEMYNLLDLILLNVNLKQEKAGLISYESNGKYYVGFYYPSYIQATPLSFIYYKMDKAPCRVYYFNPLDFNPLSCQPRGSANDLKIRVANLATSPHEFVSNIVIKNFSVVGVKDLYSIASVSLSLFYETAEIPFLLYDVSLGVYFLNVYIELDEEYYNLFLYCKDNYKGPYIIVRDTDIVPVDKPDRIGEDYIIVPRVRSFPFSRFIGSIDH